MELKTIEIAKVAVSAFAREREGASVRNLAKSMATIGLLNPITVVQSKYSDPNGIIQDGGFRVVAGGHRFEAAKMLGWDTIRAFVMDCDEADYPRLRMVEISENLHRKELSALERSKLVAEWCELVGGEKPIQSELVSGGRGKRGGESEAARQLGLSQPDVHRARKVAGLSELAQEKARELGFDDNRSALLEAAKESEPERQAKRLEQRAELRARMKDRMDRVGRRDFDYKERWKKRITLTWLDGDVEWQDEFLESVGAIRQ